MANFPELCKKIFAAHKKIRSVTISRFDGTLLHTEMRPGVKSLNPLGVIERKEAEVLVPTLSEYFEIYGEYLGKVSYMGAKFEKVSMMYMKHRNLFFILSVEPGVSMTKVVPHVWKVLEKNFR